MSMKRIALLPVVLALVSFACSVNNRDADDDSIVGTTGNVTGVDRDFVEYMAHANLAEVELGRLAIERAANPQVKLFADMMVTDHSQAAESLKQVAIEHAIPTPTGLDENHSELKTKLSGLRGRTFDREYMTAMVQGHEGIVDRLQTRATEERFGDDKIAVRSERSDNRVEAALNEWATQALPTTRYHLEEAKRIHGSRAVTRR
jgi:putative membrane protein